MSKNRPLSTAKPSFAKRPTSGFLAHPGLPAPPKPITCVEDLETLVSSAPPAHKSFFSNAQRQELAAWTPSLWKAEDREAFIDECAAHARALMTIHGKEVTTGRRQTPDGLVDWGPRSEPGLETASSVKKQLMALGRAIGRTMQAMGDGALGEEAISQLDRFLRIPRAVGNGPQPALAAVRARRASGAQETLGRAWDALSVLQAASTLAATSIATNRGSTPHLKAGRSLVELILDRHIARFGGLPEDRKVDPWFEGFMQTLAKRTGFICGPRVVRPAIKHRRQLSPIHRRRKPATA